MCFCEGFLRGTASWMLRLPAAIMNPAPMASTSHPARQDHTAWLHEHITAHTAHVHTIHSTTQQQWDMLPPVMEWLVIIHTTSKKQGWGI